MPVYETEIDQTRENAVADALADAWKRTLGKLPAGSWVDWLVFNGAQCVGVVEIKCRKNLISDYDTYMISAFKWTSVINVAYALKVTPILAVAFGDGRICYTNLLTNQPVAADMNGRIANGEPAEPVVYLPLARFVSVAE
jgi:hypothetical protein